MEENGRGKEGELEELQFPKKKKKRVWRIVLLFVTFPEHGWGADGGVGGFGGFGVGAEQWSVERESNHFLSKSDSADGFER